MQTDAVRPVRSSLRALLACVSCLAVFGACGAEESGWNDDLLVSGEKRYSQYDEELIIRHYFRDRRGGVFLDVGSFHPRQNSTTYYLESRLGWSGIAIDALPGLAPGYRKHRPATRFFNYIVTDHSGTLETLHVAGPLSSVSEEWVEQLPAARETEFEAKEIQVPTITLDELLEANSVSQIDFLSMDIEGSEIPALRGFDLERFAPALVCIEVAQANRAEALAYFERRGYVRIEKYLAHDRVNWYFKPKGAPGPE
jgi:FkbM family methyltransferase